MTPTATYQEKDFLEVRFDERKEKQSLKTLQLNVIAAGADWLKYYQTQGAFITYAEGSSLDAETFKKPLHRIFINKAFSRQGVLNFKEPIVIEITKVENHFLAWCDEFNVSGNGENVEEALNDLYAFLVHIFFSYLHTESSGMSIEAIRHFERIKELLTSYEELSPARD